LAAVHLAAAFLLFGLVSAGQASVEILSPQEVLESATVRLNGDLHLVVGAGPTVPLITDPQDPEILNPGDGAFHPAPIEIVEEAVSFVGQSFVGAVDFRIFILPYPRSGQHRSTAENGVIYLTPGVRPYTREQIHFLIAHEVGHIVHQQLLPDIDEEGWDSYREVRGLQNESVYHDNAVHPNRPHEIFAEDFRQLYGGPVGSPYSQENRVLPRAQDVRGLKTFFASLLPALASLDDSPLVFGPNPFRPGQRLAFRWPGRGEHRVEIVDISGRRLLEKTFQITQKDGFTWLWDGRDDRGRRLPSGTYFVRLSGPEGGAVGRVILVN
jgi:hypothetical protein